MTKFTAIYSHIYTLLVGAPTGYVGGPDQGAINMKPQDCTTALIGIQIAFLGWRISREIPLGDEGRRTWFPVSDYLNVLSMLAVVWFCVIEPLNNPTAGDDVAKLVLSVGYALIVMHPINMIGHYRFLSPQGRSVYELPGKDYPYITDHECITLLLTALFGLGAASRSLLAH